MDALIVKIAEQSGLKHMLSFLKLRKKTPLILSAEKHGMNKGYVEKGVLDIMNRLRRGGFEAYLVGGCVRDILLGKKPKDFDVVTDARPNQIKRLYRRCYLIGRRFRLAHVYISRDRFVEVSTFRAVIDTEPGQENGFAENNIFGTMDQDVLRRDFTVNSLYFNSADSSLVDYTGGLRDIRKKILRSIGDPERRYREDPVRMIRAARFSAQLSFSLSRQDLKAALACAPLIAEANSSRLLEELYKILRCSASARTFVNLNHFHLLKHWLPELASDKQLNRLVPRLEVLDRLRAREVEIPNFMLITAAFYDLFRDAIYENTDAPVFQDAFVLLGQRFTPLMVRLRVPRKDWDRIRNKIGRAHV